MSRVDYQRIKNQSDIIHVEVDGEEIAVYNWVNVEQVKRAVVRPGSVEDFGDDPKIGAGDSSETPDAITKWLAEDLFYRLDIDVEARSDIRVVDVTDPEVTVL